MACFLDYAHVCTVRLQYRSAIRYRLCFLDKLLDWNALENQRILSGVGKTGDYTFGIAVCIVGTVVNIVVAVFVFNRRNL